MNAALNKGPAQRAPSYYSATLNDHTEYPQLKGTVQVDVAIIGGGFILLSVLEEDFWRKLASLSGDITLAGVRDITNSSRKYVLPLLEYFDSKGVTRRVGDKRILLRKPSV